MPDWSGARIKRRSTSRTSGFLSARDWIRIICGLISSVRYREVYTADERLAWMIVLGTIPVGIAGVALQKTFQTVFGQPKLAAVFLTPSPD